MVPGGQVYAKAHRVFWLRSDVLSLSEDNAALEDFMWGEVAGLRALGLAECWGVSLAPAPVSWSPGPAG